MAENQQNEKNVVFPKIRLCKITYFDGRPVRGRFRDRQRFMHVAVFVQLFQRMRDHGVDKVGLADKQRPARELLRSPQNILKYIEFLFK